MEQKTKISVKDLHLYYGENHALKGVNQYGDSSKRCYSFYRSFRLW